MLHLMDVLNSCVTFQGPTIKTLCSIELNVVDVSLESYCIVILWGYVHKLMGALELRETRRKLRDL